MNSEKVFSENYVEIAFEDIDLQHFLLSPFCIVFEEMVDVNGTPCIATATANRMYFLDPKLNYALVHRNSWQYDQKELKFKKGDWKVKFDAYKEFGNGLWIPMKMTRTNEKTGKKEVLTVNKAQINKGVSDDYFTTGIFPEGEKIIDQTDEDPN